MMFTMTSSDIGEGTPVTALLIPVNGGMNDANGCALEEEELVGALEEVPPVHQINEWKRGELWKGVINYGKLHIN